MATGIVHFFDEARFMSGTGGIAGGTVYFYYTGTTNLAPIYTDLALTIPMTNPVVIAQGAIVPNIYLDPSITYRRRIVFSDTSVQDVDPIVAALTAGTIGTASGSSLVGFQAADTGTILRTVQDKLREIEISVKDFGAAGTALVDDTAAIKAAIAAAKTAIAGGRTGVTLFFPAGQYLVTSTITVDTSFIRLRGEGKKVSRLVRNAAYGHTLNITTGGFMEDVRVEGLGFYHDISLAHDMTGAHINADGITFLEIRDNLFDNGAYGVVLNGCVYPRVEDNQFSGNYHSGAAGYNSICAILLQKSSLAVPVQLPTIVHISRNTIVGGNGVYSYTEYPNYQYGIIVKCGEEVRIYNNTIIGMKLFNIYIQQTVTNDTLLDIFITGNFLDSAGANAFRVEGILGDGSQYIGKITFVGNQCNGEGLADLNAVTGAGDAIYIDGAARAGMFTQAVLNLTLGDNIIDNWYGNGINIQGCLSADLSNNTVRNCNANNSKSASGIVIGANAKSVTITGGSAGYKNDMSTGNTLYGLVIVDGAEVFTNGLNVKGNATGGVNDGTAAVTTTARKVWTQNCPGFNGNRASGSPVLPATTVDQFNPFGSTAYVSIFGGTVSSVKLNGQQIFGASGVAFPVGAGDKVNLTYTVAPSWVWWPQ